MDPINIYIYALASIIGMESMSIVSQKASISINPVEQTFEIHQEDLFTIIMTAEDSLAVADEFRGIADFRPNTENKTIDGLIVEKIELSKKDEQLHATVKGRYTDPKVLAEAGIHLDTTSVAEFSLINIPEWNIHSSDAVLRGNYWVWPANKPVTILMEPFNDIPEKYRKHRRSILPYWELWQSGGNKQDH